MLAVKPGYKNQLFQPKILIFLVMLFLTFDISSSVVVYAQVKFGLIITSAAIFIFPFTYFIADIISEIYGYSVMRKVIWADLTCNLLFSAMIVIVIHLPSIVNTVQKEYIDVLGRLLYISAGGFVGSLAGDFTNAYIICKFKILLKGKYFWMRSLASSAIGTLVLLLVANFIAFTKFMSFYEYLTITLNAYFLQLVILSTLSVPNTFLVRYLKKVEKIDVFDFATNFSPFKFS